MRALDIVLKHAEKQHWSDCQQVGLLCLFLESADMPADTLKNLDFYLKMCREDEDAGEYMEERRLMESGW